MLRGAVVFGLGALAGFVGALYGVASSMKSDPEWWQKMADRFRRPAAGGRMEGADEMPIAGKPTGYDPTRFRAGGRSS